MAAPVNYRSTDFAPSLPSSSSSALGPPALTRVAPPLPPRPVQQTYRPSYSSFSSSYSSPYGSSSFYSPGYSPYGYGMGGYGYGHGRLLPHSSEDVSPSRFVQQAEESSRGAFQSIESIVHAFASVSMMLDATFSAVYNSFRAVLDVANHFTRLRAHLTRVLSAFALVRTLRYLYRRLQRILGRRADSEADDLWAESANDALATTARGAEEQSVKSWPIFLFFAVVLGGPYLIWKLLSSAADTGTRDMNWASGEDDHVVARAEFDFTAASEEEISVRAGDMLNLAPKEQQPRVRGWLLASLDGQTTGLVPANYVKVLGKRRGRRQAEMEQQQMNASLHPVQTPAALQPDIQTSAARQPQPGTSQAQNVTLQPGGTEELLEEVYREAPNSTVPSSAVLNIPDKNEL